MKIVKGTQFGSRFIIKEDDNGMFHICDTSPHLPLGMGMWGVYNENEEEVERLKEIMATPYATLDRAWGIFKMVNGYD